MKCLCLPDPETRHRHGRGPRPALPQRSGAALGVPRPRADPAGAAPLRRRRALVRRGHPPRRLPGRQPCGERSWNATGRLLQMEIRREARRPVHPVQPRLDRSGAGPDSTRPCRLLRRSLERSHPNDSIVRKLYALLSQCHRRLGQAELALAACRKGREIYPDDVELLFQEGMVRRERGDRAGAKACWSQLLSAASGGALRQPRYGSVRLQGPAQPGPVVPGGRRPDRGGRALAGGVGGAGRIRAGVAGARGGVFAPGTLGELEQTARGAGRKGWAVEADILRARGHMARREFRRASPPPGGSDPPRPGGTAAAASPQLCPPTGRHGLGKQRNGRCANVLTLDPQDAEARHNLAMLLRSRNQQASATVRQ